VQVDEQRNPRTTATVEHLLIADLPDEDHALRKRARE
jgi:hypothetical protein